jgi:hypothetical protein
LFGADLLKTYRNRALCALSVGLQRTKTKD